jgi:hypothetical protein
MAAPWAIQVLTQDYLINGFYDESQDNSTAPFFFRAWADYDGKIANSAAMHLTNIQFQPTRASAFPGGSAADWFMYSHMVVAVMPHDEQSTLFVANNNNKNKYMIQADIFTGSYLIRGTVLCPDRKINRYQAYFNLPVQNAEISCLLPDARLQGLKAPFAIVRTHLIQGIISYS